VARPRGKKPVVAAELDEEDDFGDLHGVEADMDEEEEAAAAPAAVGGRHVQPAWGPVPAIGLFLCLPLLVLISLMAFDMVQGMWGYQSGNRVSGLLIKPIAKTFVKDFPE